MRLTLVVLVVVVIATICSLTAFCNGARFSCEGSISTQHINSFNAEDFVKEIMIIDSKADDNSEINSMDSSDVVYTQEDADNIFDEFYKTNLEARVDLMTERFSDLSQTRFSSDLSSSSVKAIEIALKKAQKSVYGKLENQCGSLFYMYILCLRKCNAVKKGTFASSINRVGCDNIMSSQIEHYTAVKSSCATLYSTAFTDNCNINSVQSFSSCRN